MEAFATVQDMITLFRPLSQEEIPRAEALLGIVSSRLRQEAKKAGRDLDQMITADESGSLADVAKSVTVDVVGRTLMTPTSGDLGPLSQFTQSAMGYSFTGTMVSGGGGIFIKKAELAALGLRRPRYGMVDLMGGRNECTERNYD